MAVEHARYSVAGWGVGELWMESGIVLAHEFEFGAADGAREAGASARGIAAREGPAGVASLVACFLAGEDVPLQDVPLDLEWCTPFQRAVAEALRHVPRGEVVSYGELAALAGRAGAARAVGTFCARNRFVLLLPCHRVVAADGTGGYGAAGVAVKRRLLALEGVTPGRRW